MPENWWALVIVGGLNLLVIAVVWWHDRRRVPLAQIPDPEPDRWDAPRAEPVIWWEESVREKERVL